MNRSVLSALGLVGALALIATPAAAQHRRGGEERGNGSGQGKEERGNGSGQGRQRQEGQQRQESRQPESRAAQPAQAPPSPRVEAGAVPRQGVERAVPRQGVERAVPRQDVERAVPRQQGPRGDNQRNDNGRYDNQRNDNGRYDNRRNDDRRYDNRRYGYAAPRYVGPRYYSGRYYGPRYSGPRFTIAPRRFYRPYYSFRPRFSIGFGIWAGFPVSYYDPYYYPYDYYPYASATPGYVVPPQGSVNVQPNQANMGGLSFSISPDTAEVWVDGEYFGSVGEFGPESQPLGLPSGRHHIELREPGYQVSSFEVDIVAGQVIPYQGQLEP
jgi:hypothetical protein